MAFDTKGLKNLAEHDVKFGMDEFEVASAFQYLKTNGYENIKGINDYKDLIRALGDIEAINTDIDSELEKEIADIFAQGKMVDAITLKYLLEKYDKELQSKGGKEKFQSLVKEYVEKYGTYKEVDNIKAELSKEFTEGKPEADKETISEEINKMVDTKLLGFDPEEKEILDDRSSIIEEKVQEIKNPLEQKLLDDKAALNESKKSILERIEDILNEKLSEEQKKEIEKSLDTKDATKIEQTVGASTNEQIRIIEEEVEKYYDFKELKEEETIGIVKQELRERGISENDSKIFQNLSIKRLAGISPDNRERAIEVQIGAILDNHTHNIIYHIVDDEFRRNVAMLSNTNVDYREVIFNLILLRNDVKKNVQLYALIYTNRTRILEMIRLQAEALAGPNAGQAPVQQQQQEPPKLSDIERRKAEMRLRQLLEAQKGLQALYQKNRMTDILNKVMVNKVIISNPIGQLITTEQKVAIKNYAGFVANSNFLPNNMNIRNWASQYSEMKRPVLGYVPYQFEMVRRTDGAANYMMQNSGYTQRLVFNQNFDRIFSRIGGQTGGMSHYIDNTWSNAMIGAKNNAQSLGQMFTQGRGGGMDGGGIGNTAGRLGENVNNIGNNLGRGAQNLAQNAGLTGPNIKRGAENALKGGNKAANALLKAGEGMLNIPKLALSAVTGKAILIFLVVIIVAILLISILMSGSISSLVPPNAYGGQVAEDEDPGTGEGTIIDDVCYVTRKIDGKTEQIPYLGVFGSPDRCGGYGIEKGSILINGTSYRYLYCENYGSLIMTSSTDCPLRGECYLDKTAYEAYKKLIDRVKEELRKMGKSDNTDELKIAYAYRDYGGQVERYDTYINHNGNIAAKPGNSPHQSGLTYDAMMSDKFDYSYWRKFDWYNLWEKYAHDYGYYNCLEVSTCGAAEPWHWEFRNKLKEGEQKVCDDAKNEIVNSDGYTNVDPKILSGNTDSTRVYDIKRTYKPEYIIVHHTATEYNKSAEYTVKNLSDQSPEGKDLSAQTKYLSQGYLVDYNVLIDKDGNTVAGTPDKYWTINAGNNDYNFRSLTVALVGNYGNDKYTGDELTRKQRDALVAQINKWMKIYNIPKEKVIKHKDVIEGDKNLPNYGKTVTTDCPGKNVSNMWETIKKELVIVPTATPRPVKQEISI